MQVENLSAERVWERKREWEKEIDKRREVNFSNLPEIYTYTYIYICMYNLLSLGSIQTLWLIYNNGSWLLLHNIIVIRLMIDYRLKAIFISFIIFIFLRSQTILIIRLKNLPLTYWNYSSTYTSVLIIIARINHDSLSMCMYFIYILYIYIYIGK